MTFEVVTGLILCLSGDLFWLVNLVSIVILWIATGFISVPLHNKLVRGFDVLAIQKLVSTNWIRTILWSLRSISLMLYLMGQMVASV